MPAAVGLAVLRVLREEKLAERAAEMGGYFMDALRALQQRYECIGDVRGRGLLIGLEIVKDRESRQAGPAARPQGSAPVSGDGARPARGARRLAEFHPSRTPAHRLQGGARQGHRHHGQAPSGARSNS